jgi:hypothetical protein
MVPRTLDVDTCANCNSVCSTIETYVVAIGTIRYMDFVPKTIPLDHQKKFRPYMAGVSATSYLSTACTMNVPYKKQIGNSEVTGDPIYKILLSSNNHCFGRENDAVIGEADLQPSPYDGGTLLDKIGNFSFGVETKYSGFTCSFRNFAFNLYKALFRVFNSKSLSNNNRVDIAFSEPMDINEISYDVFGIEGKIVGKGSHIEGTKVMKSGRTTAVTEGVILDDSWIGQVQGSRGTATYEDCVLCNLDCDGGDSGSPIVSKTETGNLLYHGALFAGSPGVTIYCKVENIENEAGVELAIL